MPARIFRDTSLNDILWEQGYVTIPFLEKEVVSSIISKCSPYVPENLNHFFATTHSPDLDIRKTVNRIIQEAIQKASEQVFDQAVLLGGAYISKPALGKGILELHQDWNIVDEHHHRSFNLWIPLVDTSKKNGAVHVLPKSHNQEQTLRGPGISQMFEGMNESIYPHLTC